MKRAVNLTSAKTHALAATPRPLPMAQATAIPPTEWESLALDRASDEVRLGTWYCEPYCDTINDYPYDEFMYILEGTVELQYPGGSSQTFGPGSALILPKGFSGVWKQDEPMLKYFVMIK